MELSRRPSKSSINSFTFLTVIYQTDTKFVLSTIDASDTMVDDSSHNLSFSFHLIYSIWSWVLTRERYGINITLYQLSLQSEQQGFSGNNKPFKYDRGNGTLGGLWKYPLLKKREKSPHGDFDFFFFSFQQKQWTSASFTYKFKDVGWFMLKISLSPPL